MLTCDCGDSRARTVPVRVPADVRAGDLLVLAGTGAYHEAGEPVVSVADGSVRSLVRRVSVTDLLPGSR
ncbi:hypothetical protein [Actinoplanes sp. NPDC026670]|uniref:hypothetical protein n=1 Tax=Actinoplanes sp. NPDC026670 TaxID=3154700 RepID=UPI0033EAB53F